MQQKQRPEGQRLGQLPQGGGRLARGHVALERVLDELLLRLLDPRVLERRVGDVVPPEEGGQRSQQSGDVEAVDPADGLDDETDQWPGDDRAQVPAHHGRGELALFGRWRPLADQVLQCWVEGARKGAGEEAQDVDVDEVGLSTERTEGGRDTGEAHREQNDRGRPKAIGQESSDERGEEVAPEVGAQQNAHLVL